MKASQQAIERGVKDCLFVDYKRRSGHFDVTTVASIKEITEKVPRTWAQLGSSYVRDPLPWPLRLSTAHHALLPLVSSSVML